MAEGADEGSPADKPYPPSQKKIEDARRKGQVPRSTDLNTAVAYAGVVLATGVWGGAMLTGMGAALTSYFSPALWKAVDLRSGATAVNVAGPLLEGLKAMAPFFALPAVLVLAAIMAQRTMIFHGGNIEPKLSKLNPLENAKKKYGRRGLFDFFKSFVKLSLYAALLAWFIYRREPQIIQSAMFSHAQVILLLGELALGFFTVVLAIAVILGALDYGFQHTEHLRNLRMSHKELMDELKNTEGDPMMKHRRRQRGQEIAQMQMLHKVKDADVIVVNPEHYAVALKWERAPGTAPVCVAKGVDELAMTIRRLASEADVPIYRDPPTARALHATTELDTEIAPEHYAPVAAAIRFAEDMRRKQRAKPYGPR